MRQELLTIYNLREELKETEKKAAKKMDEGIPYVLILKDKAIVFSTHAGRLEQTEAAETFGVLDVPPAKREKIERSAVGLCVPLATLDKADAAFAESAEKNKADWFDTEIAEALCVFGEGAELPSLPRSKKVRRTVHLRPATFEILKEAAAEADVSVSKMASRLALLRFGGGET